MGLKEELSGHDGRAIANFILSRYDAKKWDISNKKINKLIYFVHGFGLVRLEKKLVRNYFEAWDHGPVVKVVYDAFKNFGFNPISKPATYIDLFDGQENVISFDSIENEDKLFIIKIIEHHLKYSANDLEKMTHSFGTPWHQIRSIAMNQPVYQMRIPDSLIRSHFVEILGEKRLLN